MHNIVENTVISIELSEGQLAAPQLFKDRRYTLSRVRDYDGNLHAGATNPEAASAYKFQKLLDINGDGTKEAVFTNDVSGRWVTASIDPITGKTNFSDYGKGGSTRVVGLYVDPLVESGQVIKGSKFDSQTRFQDDLNNDNLVLRSSGDYDFDGIMEVYWKTADGSSYLRALMHADGNIRYANYQNEQQMRDYLTAHGHHNAINEII